MSVPSLLSTITFYPILLFFFFNDTATTEIYTLSLHDALPISLRRPGRSGLAPGQVVDVKDLPPEVRGETGAAGAPEGDWRRVLEREVASRLARGESDIADPLTRDFETVLIVKALQHTGGRRIEAAGLLGIGRNTLTRKVQELKIDTKD